MSFILTSSAFNHNDRIPIQYTCSGEDIYPPLEWEGVPESTRSFSLIMDDPDATNGTWDHWLIYNIPPNIVQITAGQEGFSMKFANNSWGRKSYGGPCPPPGKDHRYFFTIYALNIVLELNHTATKQDLLEATKGHILAKAELVGIYSR